MPTHQGQLSRIEIVRRIPRSSSTNVTVTFPVLFFVVTFLRNASRRNEVIASYVTNRMRRKVAKVIITKSVMVMTRGKRLNVKRNEHARKVNTTKLPESTMFHIVTLTWFSYSVGDIYTKHTKSGVAGTALVVYNMIPCVHGAAGNEDSCCGAGRGTPCTHLCEGEQNYQT